MAFAVSGLASLDYVGFSHADGISQGQRSGFRDIMKRGLWFRA